MEDKIITLNVGGVLYTTTLSTLTSKESMLRTMFSGDFIPTKLFDKDGNPFIDRNGKIFAIILEYLRTGEVYGICDRDVITEFKYFGFEVSQKDSEIKTNDFDQFVKEWEASPAHDYFIGEFVKNFYVDPIESRPDLDRKIYSEDTPREMRYKFMIPLRYVEYILNNFKLGKQKRQLTRWLKDKYNFEWCDILYQRVVKLGEDIFIIDIKYKKEE